MPETYLNKTIWKLTLNKTRMAIASKGKGKSGGARVLTYNVTKTASGNVVVTLLSIFDKGEMENVSDAYIKSLVKETKGNESTTTNIF